MREFYTAAELKQKSKNNTSEASKLQPKIELDAKPTNAVSPNRKFYLK